jgi:hypothetical protein
MRSHQVLRQQNLLGQEGSGQRRRMCCGGVANVRFAPAFARAAYFYKLTSVSASPADGCEVLNMEQAAERVVKRRRASESTQRERSARRELTSYRQVIARWQLAWTRTRTMLELRPPSDPGYPRYIQEARTMLGEIRMQRVLFSEQFAGRTDVTPVAIVGQVLSMLENDMSDRLARLKVADLQ